MRGRNRLLTGVALGVLLMGATNSQSVAQEPTPAGMLTVSIDGSQTTAGIFSGLFEGKPSFGFLPAAVNGGLIGTSVTVIPTDTVTPFASFQTLGGEQVNVALTGDPDPSLLLNIGFIDPGAPTAFFVSTGVVAIVPVFGPASWSRRATIDVLSGSAAMVMPLLGPLGSEEFVELDINGVPLDLLLPNPVVVGGDDDDPLPPGTLTTTGVLCPPMPVGCFGLSLAFGALGNGESGPDDPGSFTIQAQSILVAVPEPVTLSLFGLAMAGLGAALRRRHLRAC